MAEVLSVVGELEGKRVKVVKMLCVKWFGAKMSSVQMSVNLLNRQYREC